VLNEKEELVGILSKGDLYRQTLRLSMHTSGKSYSKNILRSTTVADIMTKEPVRVFQNQQIELAGEILLQGKFHAIPVMNEDKIVGILTAKDILAAVPMVGIN